MQAVVDRVTPLLDSPGVSWWHSPAGDLAVAGSVWASAARPAIAWTGFLDTGGSVLLDGAPIAALFEARPHDFAQRIDGDFALAIADVEARRLVLVRDAVGARPLYYAEHGPLFCFASELRVLQRALGTPARPKLDVVAEVLDASWRLGADETLLNGTHALPAAHLVTVTPERVACRRYWEARGDEWSHVRRFPDAVDAFGELFVRSVRRRVGRHEHAAVLVSGGVDSSAIFCTAVARIGVRVSGIYHGASDGSAADETGWLAHLNAIGPIERVPFEPSGFPELVPACVAQSEFPLAHDLPGPILRAYSAAASAGATVLLNGTWADQLLFPFPPPYLLDLVRTLRWQTAFEHARSFPHWMRDVPAAEVWNAMLRNLARAHLPAWWLRRRAARRVRHAGIARLLHGDLPRSPQNHPPNHRWAATQGRHGAAVAGNVRSRRDTMVMEWTARSAAASGLHVAHPFLDRDLITFLVSVDGALQSSAGVPKALLRAALRGTVPEPILARRDKGDYTNAVERTLEAGASTVLERLRNGTAVRLGFLDPKPLYRGLASISASAHIPMSDVPGALSALLAFDCWLDTFAL